MRQLAPQVESDPAVSAASLNAAPNYRTLLYVGPPEVLSGAVAAAIQREFPFLKVLQSVRLQAALEEFDVPLRLVLVDAIYAHELSDCAADLLAQHPSAAIAIVTDSDLHGGVERFHLVDTRQVQGVLPLNVSLDVLLSMLHIILRGGTYFPSIDYLQPDDVSSRHEGRGSHQDPGLGASDEAQGRSLRQLTKRENEILGKIAQGNQNKIIASTLGLSEHTVKIHIHNIITKLGVHNRTEAVALYFECREREADTSGVEYDGSLGRNSLAGGNG